MLLTDCNSYLCFQPRVEAGAGEGPGLRQRRGGRALGAPVSLLAPGAAAGWKEAAAALWGLVLGMLRDTALGVLEWGGDSTAVRGQWGGRRAGGAARAYCCWCLNIAAQWICLFCDKCSWALGQLVASLIELCLCLPNSGLRAAGCWHSPGSRSWCLPPRTAQAVTRTVTLRPFL